MDLTGLSLTGSVIKGVTKMKVYRVVYEQEGATTKEPGKVSTELVRSEIRYAAETLQEVWDAIKWLRTDEERNVLAIVEEAPAITVLSHDIGTFGKFDQQAANKRAAKLRIEGMEMDEKLCKELENMHSGSHLWAGINRVRHAIHAEIDRLRGEIEK